MDYPGVALQQQSGLGTLPGEVGDPTLLKYQPFEPTNSAVCRDSGCLQCFHMMSCAICSSYEAHSFLRSHAFKAPALGLQLLWNKVNVWVTPKEAFG